MVVKMAPNVQKIIVHLGRYVDEKISIWQIMGERERKNQEKEIKKLTSNIEEVKSKLDKMELFKERS